MAETRTIRTVLELNAQRYTAGAAQAAAAAKSLAGELGKIGDATGAQRANYDRVSNSLLGVGTAAAAGLGLAAKASMDWESAWAGVLKTVDGSPEELAALEDGLRGLTKVLPATHAEIAGVAEAAGQLGVAQEDILGFTETMINLGETTNLTSEEAATSLAQLMNIMGTSGDDVDNLGSALVALGNDGASTEKDILSMGLRVSAVGAQMGLTEAEVLALASAMSSVGIEAEAGGTAISTVMKRIDASVREGGDALTGWADVAGVSAADFKTAWETDAAGALNMVTTGLGEAGAAGEDMNGILNDLGVKGIREADTMLRLAQSGDLLADSLDTGNEAWERNLALVQEAEQRYQTTEAQLQIARNSLVDAGIDIGAAVLPVLADVAGGVADLASWFSALPEPVQRSVTGLGAMVGVTGLVAGGMMRLVPAAIDTVGAFRDLRTTSPQTASALGKVAGFAGRAAGAFAALQIAGAVVDTFREAETGSEGISAGLLNLAETGEITKASLDELFAATGTGNAEVRDLSHALEILDAGPAAQTFDFLASGLGVFDTQTEVATRRLGELDRAFAALYSSGNMEALSDALAQSGVPVEELIESLPTLNAELTATATGMGLEADAATLAKIATGELTPTIDETTGAVTGYKEGTEGSTEAVEEQVDALEELQNRLQGTSDLLLGVRGSERDFLASIDEATQAIEDNGKVLDENGNLLDRHSEKGRASQAALDGIASSTQSWADSAEEAGASAEELDGIMSEGRQTFIDAAQDMGMSEEAAIRLADELQLIPEFVSTEVEVNTTAAMDAAIAFADGVAALDPAEVPVGADTSEAEDEVHVFGSQVGDVPATVYVESDLFSAQESLESFYATMMEQGGTVTINGETADARETLDTLIEEVNNGEGTVMINGTPVSAETSLLQLIDIINGSDGTVTIDGNNVPANLKTDAAKRKADGTTGTIDVDAATGAASASIDWAARNRDTWVNVRVRQLGQTVASIVGTAAALGKADGGWLNEGLNAGGWVPGPYPGKGVDNILWPMAGKAGGGMLTQPLAGTEYVVNGQSAQQWGPALEAINAGVSQAQLASMLGAGGRSGGGFNLSQHIHGPDARKVAQESYTLYRHEARNQVVNFPGG